ncbi:MAG: hypothetical protein AABX98_06380 [Nanoarchaeota archaeon]
MGDKKDKIEWFPYWLTSILILLGAAIFISIQVNRNILAVLFSLIFIYLFLAFAGWIIAPFHLEKTVIKFLKNNYGRLPVKSIEEYFITNSKKNHEVGIETATRILKRLEKKGIILIEDSIVKLIT